LFRRRVDLRVVQPAAAEGSGRHERQRCGERRLSVIDVADGSDVEMDLGEHDRLAFFLTERKSLRGSGEAHEKRHEKAPRAFRAGGASVIDFAAISARFLRRAGARIRRRAQYGLASVERCGGRAEDHESHEFYNYILLSSQSRHRDQTPSDALTFS